MTVDEIKKLYGFTTAVEVGKRFNVSKVAVGKWEKKGIPALRQTAFEVLSGGKLKTDETALKELETA